MKVGTGGAVHTLSLEENDDVLQSDVQLIKLRACYTLISKTPSTSMKRERSSPRGA